MIKALFGRAPLYQRYFARQIYAVFLFVLLAFAGLFFFFDLLAEMDSINRLYTIPVALAHAALMAPGHFYEIIPIASLIAAIYVFAQLASQSEFTILRVAGLNFWRATVSLLRIGAPLVIATYLIGELAAPYAAQLGEKIRLQALGATVASNFKSGVWVRDSVNENGRPVSRFINIGALQPDQSIAQIRSYEFDDQFHLRTIRLAAAGRYAQPGEWTLTDVSETRLIEQPADGSGLDAQLAPNYAARQTRVPTLQIRSELTPQILSVLMVKPESMAIYDLFEYIGHLRENRQDTRRYEIALWKKVVYPLTVLVMLILALPFAYLHARAGAVGVKVFGGIMLGMSFVLVNTMFAHVGMLSSWPTWLAAFGPAILYLTGAFAALFWVERH